jgi:hypothetical protein
MAALDESGAAGEDVDNTGEWASRANAWRAVEASDTAARAAAKAAVGAVVYADGGAAEGEEDGDVVGGDSSGADCVEVCAVPALDQ